MYTYGYLNTALLVRIHKKKKNGMQEDSRETRKAYWRLEVKNWFCEFIYQLCGSRVRSYNDAGITFSHLAK